MKKLTTTLAALLAAAGVQALACTSIIVAKGASTDGSVMTTYNCDSYGTFHPLYHFPAADHPAGTMMPVYDRDTRVYHGDIPQAAHTYNVVGHINEWQVTISETTFGGRHEMVDSTGILDYGSLMNVALQRSKTAREAIGVMTSLAETYGYNSEGETFSVCDPNEAWIMEMMGTGPGSKGVVWVAIRIPDNAVACHANHSRIHRFDQKDKQNVIYSKNVISYARKMGWFSGKDADFSFSDTYAPAGFDELRWCEARVWAFYNRYSTDMERYLPYAMGLEPAAEPMPLWIVPNRKLSVHDVEVALRDHYEGTPLALDNDPGQGIYQAPYRPTPLSYEVDGKQYFNERPIATQQTAFTWIGQMRSWLPREIGGILWFGNDDGNMVAYTPVYCNSTDIPEPYKQGKADAVTFSMDNAFWVCNWVSNMVYARYSLLMPELEAVRDSLESSYFAAQPAVETRARQLHVQSPALATEYLTQYGKQKGAEMLDEWQKLATRMIVKYNDGVVHLEKDGKWLMKKGDWQPQVSRPGYPEHVARKLVEATGDRFLMPEKKK